MEVLPAMPGKIKGRLTPTEGDTTWRLTARSFTEANAEGSEDPSLSGREAGGLEAMVGKLQHGTPS